MNFSEDELYKYYRLLCRVVTVTFMCEVESGLEAFKTKPGQLLHTLESYLRFIKI
jgi:hypothetical protein